MTEPFITEDVFPVLVNHDIPLTDLIAQGNFTYVAPGITAERFGSGASGIEQLSVRIVRLPDCSEFRTEALLEWMTAHRLRPLRAQELLSLTQSLQGGYLQRNANALGSIWRDAQGIGFVLSASLKKSRRLRLFRIDVEPAWAAVWDCFPCTALA